MAHRGQNQSTDRLFLLSWRGEYSKTQGLVASPLAMSMAKRVGSRSDRATFVGY